MPDYANKSMLQTKTRSHEVGIDKRIKITIERQAKDITKFVVSLEYLHEQKWYSVVRIDTEGGTPHRDRLLPNGDHLTHRESIRLSLDWSLAITEAQHDLQSRADWYISEFIKHF